MVAIIVTVAAGIVAAGLTGAERYWTAPVPPASSGSMPKRSWRAARAGPCT